MDGKGKRTQSLYRSGKGVIGWIAGMAMRDHKGTVEKVLIGSVGTIVDRLPRGALSIMEI